MSCHCFGRRVLVVAVVVAGLAAVPATAEQTLQAVGESIPLPYDAASQQIDAIHPDAVATARALGLPARFPGAIPFELDRNSLGTLNFPMRLRLAGRGASGAGISNFVDLDGTAAIWDYACGQRTYDGHRGVDIFTWPFSLWKMDNNDAEIVAAAPGTIVQKVDGNQDRNCVPLTTTPSPQANLVAVRHDDGAFAYYVHMKSGSLTSKGVGERVVTGEKLGIVGSSGRSTAPHLHFEMRDDVNATIDPFAGLCGVSGTLWKHQWQANADFKIVQVASLSAPPAFAACDTSSFTYPGSDTPNFQDSFSPGQQVLATTFLRDQPAGSSVHVQVFNPNGTAVLDANTSGASRFFLGSYWYFPYTLPAGAPAGAWRIRASISTGQVLEHTFFVSTSPAATSLVGAVLPSGRSIQTSSIATVFATVLNGGSQTALGCWIQPETPLAATFSFQTTNPATNTLTGSPNTNVSIPPGGAQSFVLAFAPVASAVSQAVTTTLRFKCTNADAAPLFEGVNTLLLSFDPSPVPDVIPIAATLSNDGVVHVPGVGATQVWSAASVNIGVGANLTVEPQLVGTGAANVTICETNPSTGVCLGSTASSVTMTFATNSVHTFALFVQASGGIAFDPANTRIRLNFTDAGGVVRGQTSVAVTTN